jgi:ABC-type glutathione transport system ATPase component
MYCDMSDSGQTTNHDSLSANAGEAHERAAEVAGATPVVRCRHLSKRYVQGPQQVDVLLDVNLDVYLGECIAVVGSSGSGKTTLLNMLGGLDMPSGGQIEVAGCDLASMNDRDRASLRNRYLGFVYQFHHLLGEFSALQKLPAPGRRNCCPVWVCRIDLRTNHRSYLAVNVNASPLPARWSAHPVVC